MARRLELIDPKSPWTRDQARHLLNRAGFGMPVSALDKLSSLGAGAAVALMVDYEGYPDPFTEPDWFTDREVIAARRRELKDAPAEERQMAFRELQRKQREDVEKMKTWWLERMAKTTRPLQEKMTLFWHGHFAVSAEKVKEPEFNYQLNKVFRDTATGNFRDLVFEVGKSPAMLEYLDNNRNKKGHPNENWARELMELFTMGIGNYTEEDIKEAARAFTGYTHRNGNFTFVEKDHDFGEKTFLGRTGKFDGADVINIIMEQPATAHFISRKLWEYLVYENPDDALIDEVAALFREGDYELKPLLRTIFLSKEFYSDRAMQGLVKSPAQYIVSLQDHLGVDTPRGSLLTLAMRALGQDLFYPPNVKGWDGNRAWINSNTALARYNIPVYLALGRRPNIEPEARLDSMVGDGGMMSDDSMTGGDTMMAPAFQQQGKPGPERREALQRRLAEARQKRAESSPAKKTAAKAPKKPSTAMSKLLVQLEPLFQPFQGRPVKEAVLGLSTRLFGRTLDEQQYRTLASVLAERSLDEPLTETTIRNNGPAFIQLALSMAEYQLC
ncbi:DUF1800 family protein [bacterium]|nr:DUF1800 family protein [bacterium]